MWFMAPKGASPVNKVLQVTSGWQHDMTNPPSYKELPLFDYSCFTTFFSELEDGHFA